MRAINDKEYRIIFEIRSSAGRGGRLPGAAQRLPCRQMPDITHSCICTAIPLSAHEIFPSLPL
jgi:hypothetical protein